MSVYDALAACERTAVDGLLDVVVFEESLYDCLSDYLVCVAIAVG